MYGMQGTAVHEALAIAPGGSASVAPQGNASGHSTADAADSDGTSGSATGDARTTRPMPQRPMRHHLASIQKTAAEAAASGAAHPSGTMHLTSIAESSAPAGGGSGSGVTGSGAFASMAHNSSGSAEGTSPRSTPISDSTGTAGAGVQGTGRVTRATQGSQRGTSVDAHGVLLSDPPRSGKVAPGAAEGDVFSGSPVLGNVSTGPSSR